MAWWKRAFQLPLLQDQCLAIVKSGGDANHSRASWDKTLFSQDDWWSLNPSQRKWVCLSDTAVPGPPPFSQRLKRPTSSVLFFFSRKGMKKKQWKRRRQRKKTQGKEPLSHSHARKKNKYHGERGDLRMVWPNTRSPSFQGKMSWIFICPASLWR